MQNWTHTVGSDELFNGFFHSFEFLLILAQWFYALKIDLASLIEVWHRERWKLTLELIQRRSVIIHIEFSCWITVCNSAEGYINDQVILLFTLGFLRLLCCSLLLELFFLECCTGLVDGVVLSSTSPVRHGGEAREEVIYVVAQGGWQEGPRQMGQESDMVWNWNLSFALADRCESSPGDEFFFEYGEDPGVADSFEHTCVEENGGDRGAADVFAASLQLESQSLHESDGGVL